MRGHHELRLRLSRLPGVQVVCELPGGEGPPYCMNGGRWLVREVDVFAGEVDQTPLGRRRLSSDASCGAWYAGRSDRLPPGRTPWRVHCRRREMSERGPLDAVSEVADDGMDETLITDMNSETRPGEQLRIPCDRLGNGRFNTYESAASRERGGRPLWAAPSMEARAGRPSALSEKIQVWLRSAFERQFPRPEIPIHCRRRTIRAVHARAAGGLAIFGTILVGSFADSSGHNT